MNKGKGIGIAVAVIAISVLFGIAYLPDEVLLESPNLENSDNTVSEVPNIPDVELPPTPVIEETPVEETPVEETPVEETPVEETPVEEDDEGEVIKINIRDGIGAGFK